MADLTTRELDVLKLIAEGMPNIAIGRKLWITPETVKSHVGRIFHKLDVENRTQAAVKAIREGIID